MDLIEITSNCFIQKSLIKTIELTKVKDKYYWIFSFDLNYQKLSSAFSKETDAINWFYNVTKK